MTKTPDGKFILNTCVEMLEDKHVTDLRAYDVRGKSPITDFFLVGSVRNERQMKAAGQNVMRHLKKQGIRPYHTDGELNNGSWIVLDYVDCIVHLFSRESRDFYHIDDLWKDCELALQAGREPNENHIQV